MNYFLFLYKGVLARQVMIFISGSESQNKKFGCHEYFPDWADNRDTKTEIECTCSYIQV